VSYSTSSLHKSVRFKRDYLIALLGLGISWCCIAITRHIMFDYEHVTMPLLQMFCMRERDRLQFWGTMSLSRLCTHPHDEGKPTDTYFTSALVLLAWIPIKSQTERSEAGPGVCPLRERFLTVHWLQDKSDLSRVDTSPNQYTFPSMSFECRCATSFW